MKEGVGMQSYAAIDDEKIKGLCLELQNYVDRMKKIFNDMDSVVDQSKQDWVGANAIEFYGKYDEVQKYYPTIVENMKSYVDEFYSVIQNYQKIDQELSTQLEREQSKLKEGDGNNANNW